MDAEIKFSNKFEDVIEAEQTSFISFKKKVIIFVLIMFAIGIFISVFIGFDFSGFIRTLQNVINNTFKISIFSILLLWIFLRIYYFIFLYYFRLKRMEVRVLIKEWVVFGVISMLLVGLTPTSAGSEPYVAYFLRKKKIPPSKLTALTFSNGFLSQLSMYIIVFPIYIYSMKFWGYIYHNGSASDVSALVFLNVGVALMTIVLLFYICLCCSKHIHYYLSRAFNTCKKYLGLDYHTKLETIKTYLYESTLKKQFLAYIKDWKITSIIVGGLIFYNCLMFISMNFSAIVMDDSNLYKQINHFWINIFLISGLSVGANGFLPMPGGEGSLQIIYLALFDGFVKDNDIPHQQTELFSQNMMFLWRSVTFYLPLLGSFLAIIFIFSFKRLFKMVNSKDKNY